MAPDHAHAPPKDDNENISMPSTKNGSLDINFEASCVSNLLQIILRQAKIQDELGKFDANSEEGKKIFDTHERGLRQHL